MKRFLSIFFALSIALGALALPAAAADTQMTLRIGLYYGSNALEAPQLQNFVGSGYQAGYYDSAKAFHSLYPIAQEKVVLIGDGTYSLLADNTYARGASSGAAGTIGGYSVQLPQAYGSAAEASAAASSAGGYAVYQNGAYYVRTGNYTELSAAQSAAAQSGGTATGGSGTEIRVVETGTVKVLFAYDGGQAFAMHPLGTNTETWFKGYKYYGDFVYLREGGNLTVINYAGLDDYVKGVVPYEMSPSWHVEALKAQAVCARSFALGSLDKHKSMGFDVCNTTDCQVYYGTNRATVNSDTAVNATAGEYVAVDGKVVAAYFYAADGGATEDAENVWGGNYSYLKGKLDPYEDTQNASNGVWSVTLTPEEVRTKVNAAGYSIGPVASVAVTARTAVGNVLTVTVTDTSGKTAVIEKAKTRSVFGLNSQRYDITAGGAGGGTTAPSGTLGGSILAGINSALGLPNGTSSGGASATGYTFSGTGWGHHVGMSQNGAKAMAEQGFSYRDILNFYYTGITIEK